MKNKMNVLIKVPEGVLQYCKNKLKLSDKKISALYKSYIDFLTNQTTHQPLDGFVEWLEENGEEILEEE